MIVAHRRTVNDAQEHLPAWFDLYGLWVGQSAVIGEKCVVFDVVQIAHRRAPLRYAGYARHRCDTPCHTGHADAVSQTLENLLGRREAEIVEQ